jgi:hypothetical protein
MRDLTGEDTLAEGRDNLSLMRDLLNFGWAVFLDPWCELRLSLLTLIFHLLISMSLLCGCCLLASTGLE